MTDYTGNRDRKQRQETETGNRDRNRDKKRRQGARTGDRDSKHDKENRDSDMDRRQRHETRLELEIGKCIVCRH